jgi:hypothetical protein
MATSKREQIMQAVKARLDALVPGTLTGVYRSRADAWQPGDSLSANIVPDNEDPAENVLSRIDATLAFEVQVFARGQQPDTLVDPALVAIHAALMTEPSLGGLALDTSEGGTSWDFDATDTTALIVRMRFSVQYRHLRTSLQ